jgi:hypothetical protein
VSQRLLFLYNFHRLILHWIVSEYSRCKNHQRRVFGVADPNCRHPLSALARIVRCFGRYVEIGMLKTVESPTKRDGEKETYLGEALYMCMAVSNWHLLTSSIGIM